MTKKTEQATLTEQEMGELLTFVPTDGARKVQEIADGIMCIYPDNILSRAKPKNAHPALIDDAGKTYLTFVHSVAERVGKDQTGAWVPARYEGTLEQIRQAADDRRAEFDALPWALKLHLYGKKAD